MNRLDPDAATRQKKRVAASFTAADQYDAYAIIQRTVARRVAERVAALSLPPTPRIVEIGCGTGLLSQHLVERLPTAHYLFTDLSPAMVERCRTRLGLQDGQAGFTVMDGEHPTVQEPADLVVASLAFQWFTDLPGSLCRLATCLRPGGALLFATLGAATFREWRQAHRALGLACGSHRYPTAAALQEWWPAGGRGSVTEERLLSHHEDARAFVRGLRAIGAGVPTPDHRPLSPGELRAVLRYLDEEGGGDVPITYHVLYGLFIKEE